MNPVSDTNDVLIKAARAAAEAFISTLDELSNNVSFAASATPDEPIAYDPLHDEPPFTPDPKGSETEQQMAWVTYLGAIGRLNAEEHRGASSKEISAFAKKAGYSGGNAVNGWNSRPGSPRAVENIDGARFLNSAALGWITKDATELGVEIVGEIDTVPQPPK